MKTVFSGKALVVGNNVDTDIIYPGRFLELTEPAQIGRHCFAGINEEIARGFVPGGIVVAGKNFGCGSSREHAAIALVSMGASAVIAESFARIFFRNGINLGLPLVVCKGIGGKVKDGQTLLLDLQNGAVTVQETGLVLKTEPLGDKAIEILSAGGIKELMRRRHGHEPCENNGSIVNRKGKGADG